MHYILFIIVLMFYFVLKELLQTEIKCMHAIYVTVMYIAWLIVVLKYVLTRHNAEALLSLTALVAGITTRIFKLLQTSDILH